ncbi:MAG: DUF423 domain-containing protein [Lysobacterales bacterium CG_4_9_14_3_um_filter_62_6]|nr:MAG: DUF423 domain-containing protein [Xanthomonadales bacterium CG_4_9_14_3_um_filter_62_6]
MSLATRRWHGLIALFGATAVALGAFGAHALRSVLDPAHSALWHTAVSYLFWHVLAAWLAVQSSSRLAQPAVALFLLGSTLFSGSLFALALGAPHWLGTITPVGGLALLGGWLCLAWAAYRRD